MADAREYYRVTIEWHTEQGPQPSDAVTTTWPVSDVEDGKSNPAWALAAAIQEAVNSLPSRGGVTGSDGVWDLLTEWEQQRRARLRGRSG